MANMREIRSRIKSVENTQQITRAMKMVSGAKLRRAQSSTEGMELYAQKSRELFTRLCAALPKLPDMNGEFHEMEGATSAKGGLLNDLLINGIITQAEYDALSEATAE